MVERSDVIKLLTAIQRDINYYGVTRYDLIKTMCEFVNRLFCNCKYVEYWVFDLDFGRNVSNTEMGCELKGLDTIDKFVDFLYAKSDKNK